MIYHSYPNIIWYLSHDKLHENNNPPEQGKHSAGIILCPNRKQRWLHWKDKIERSNGKIIFIDCYYQLEDFSLTSRRLKVYFSTGSNLSNRLIRPIREAKGVPKYTLEGIIIEILGF